MISPQINDTAADICERLIEINAQISGKNAEKNRCCKYRGAI